MTYAEIQARFSALDAEAAQQRTIIAAAFVAEQAALNRIQRLKEHLAGAFVESTSTADFGARLRARVDADPEAQAVAGQPEGLR